MFADGDAFDAFWSLYPRRHGKRVGKAEAERAWAKLTAADHRLIMAAVVHYAAACVGGVTLAKDAERWLAKRELWAETWQTPAVPERGTTRKAERATVQRMDDDRAAPAGRLDL